MDSSPASEPQLARRTTEEAALALHRHGLGRGEVAAVLTELITELGLATDAVYQPAAVRQATVPTEADPDVLVLPIPNSRVSGEAPPGGVLRCRPTSAEAHRSIEVLAAHASAALNRINQLAEIQRREEGLRRVAERLQDALLPPVPTIEGSLISVRYQAAAREARVGGDFYDVFPLPDGQVLLAVGDVMGKGVEAASRTSLITHTLRALALRDPDLGTIAESADQQLTYQDPDVMATLWCGLYDPPSGELVFTSLGHPPALLLRPDGEPISLILEGLPLGMGDLADQPREERSRQLGSRDLLVLYTDGLVEGSGDYLAGQAALLAAVQAHRDEPLDDLIDSLLDELLADAGHTDDAVVLALRRR